MDTEVQFSIASVQVGDDLKSIEMPITLQRLVMEAGANRDFSLIHHDRDVARATVAADAYINTFFIAGMFERLLREWMGPAGILNKISNLRMTSFNVVGDVVRFSGHVESVDEDTSQVSIALEASSNGASTVTATAVVSLPP